MRALALAAIALPSFGTPAPVFAALYATLHVRSFTMSVDRASVAVGEPFHLTISAHVDERVLQIDNLTLPDLSGFESLGDERRCTASSSGSDCVEIVTLDATIPGQRTIAGATLDAIDGRNGKPSRFTSDAVTIDVTGGPADPLTGLVTGFLFGALRALIVFILICIAIGALVWGYSVRRRTATPAPAAPAPAATPPPPPPDPDARFRALVAELANAPTRANALRVRHELRAAMNAREEETYADLSRRHAGSPRDLGALGAVERAAFCEDERVESAVREALPFLNR
jgi:hypothetical protein